MSGRDHNSSLAYLDGIVAWAERRGDVRIDIVGTIDPASRDHIAVRAQLERLRHSPQVSLSFGRSVGELFRGLGAGGFALDVYPDTTERRMAVPIRTVNALACGLPILGNLPTVLNRRLVEAGCGLILPQGGATDDGMPELERALDAAVDLDPDRYAAMRAAWPRMGRSNGRPRPTGWATAWIARSRG